MTATQLAAAKRCLSTVIRAVRTHNVDRATEGDEATDSAQLLQQEGNRKTMGNDEHHLTPTKTEIHMCLSST